jgi:hypothetical protein
MYRSTSTLFRRFPLPSRTHLSSLHETEKVYAPGDASGASDRKEGGLYDFAVLQPDTYDVEQCAVTEYLVNRFVHPCAHVCPCVHIHARTHLVAQ